MRYAGNKIWNHNTTHSQWYTIVRILSWHLFQFDCFHIFWNWNSKQKKMQTVHNSLTSIKISKLLANSYSNHYWDDTWMSEIRYTFFLHPLKISCHCLSYIPIAFKTQKIESDLLNNSMHIFHFFTFQTGSHFLSPWIIKIGQRII